MTRIHEHFNLDSLTASQRGLLDALEAFFQSDEQVFLLFGAAGTGKTFMTKGIVKWLKQRQKEERLPDPPESTNMMAFTGRAALILRQKTGFATSTIHSFVYRKTAQVEKSEKEVKHSESLVLEFGIEDSSSLTLDHCSIVDEASMFPAAKHEQEHIKFGTGRLLEDWVKRTEIGRKTNSRKAIFVGDPAQLPPVGEPNSPAQDAQYLEQNFGLKCTEFTLKEVVRQAQDSNIIRQANHVRACIEKRDWNLRIEPGRDVVKELPEASLKALWHLERGTPPPNDRIVITHSNEEARNFNQEVRSACFDELDLLHPGETLLVTSNVYSTAASFMNGELVRVVAVADGLVQRKITLKNKVGNVVKEQKVDLAFKKVKLLKDGELHAQEQFIFWPYLFNSNKVLTLDEQRALYIDFKIRNPNLKPSTMAYANALMSDPYYNCVQAKFGYAMTCHKAQGGEWPHVYLNLKQTHLGSQNENFFRWVYTAMTRASKSLHLLGLPEEEAVPVPQDEAIEVTRPAVFDDWALPLAPASQELIAAAVLNALEGHCPKLHRPVFHNYLIRFPLSVALVEVHYNGKFQISKVTCADEQVKALLAPLVKKPLRFNDGAGSFDDSAVVLPTSASTPLLRGVFLDALKERLIGTDMNVELVRTLPYQDDYRFHWGNREATFAFYFKGNGQKSKEIPLPLSDSNLVQLVLRALNIQLQ